MNDPLLDPLPPSAPEVQVVLARERSHRVAAAGWTAGCSSVFSAYALMGSPTWPLAVGVVALAGMVSFVCWMMLMGGDRRR